MKTLVIGVSNEYRGDDAAGLLVARRIGALNLPDVQVIENDGECTRLRDGWKEAERVILRVILIDAVQSGAASGTIHRFDANAQNSRPVCFNAQRMRLVWPKQLECQSVGAIAA